jgi:tetratricopeptide (TPR) repeat protein
MKLHDAFISYSHAKDKPIATALQTAIQKLGKPWYRRRALRLFRDDTSLAATPHLWPTIEQALSLSGHFLLLASPEAAASKWVNREVGYWLEHNSIDTLLIGLTDSELVWDDTTGDFSPSPSHPLPPALAKKFPNEPKWIDLRPYRDGADKGDAKFTEAAADFAAAIRGVPKEDLLSQEVREQRRALRLTVGAAAALLVLAVVAVTAGVMAYRAQQEAVAQRNRAERTLAAATETANSLVFDLAQRFKDTVAIPNDLIKDILGRARTLQDQLISSGQMTPALRRSAADALGETAASLLRIGDTTAAYAAADQARQILTELAASNAADIGLQQHLSVTYERLGTVLAARGNLGGAIKAYRDGLVILDQLAKSAPDNLSPQLQHERAALYLRIGDAQMEAGDVAAAEKSFRDHAAIIKGLLEADAHDPELRHGAFLSNIKMGDVQQRSKQFEAALRFYSAGLAIAQQLAKSDPSNARLQHDLSLTYEKIGDTQVDLGDLAAAEMSYRDFIATMERLVKSDASNAYWQQNLAVAYMRIGDIEKQRGNPATALDSYRNSVAIVERLAKADPGNADFQRDLMVTYALIAEIDASQAEVMLTRALDIAKSLRANGLLARDDAWMPSELARRLAALRQ